MSTCPNCDDDLSYTKGGVRYSHVTAVEVPGVYDGGLFFTHLTDNCGYAWHRWEDMTMRRKAQKYIDEWNERRGFTATL